VKDVGVDLGPQSVDRLLDTFYTTKRDGMGIGLSVSRSIIERHQGRLWAAANDCPGAAFHFASLPTRSRDERARRRSVIENVDLSRCPFLAQCSSETTSRAPAGSPSLNH
jgi:hypothetical protein